MKPLNRTLFKDECKIDYHPKRLFSNLDEAPKLKLLVRFSHKKKMLEGYYRLNQHHNWWENMCIKGTGKLKEEIQQEINEGVDEYINLKQPEDKLKEI